MFHNLCLSRGVSEYYLLNSDGSYLLLKDNGSASVLSVVTESKMEKLANIAKIDKSVPSYIYDGIASRGYMLVSHDNNGQLPPTSHWGDYLYPARKISGYETYYFSVQEGNEIGNHSYDHKLLTRLSKEEFQSEVNKTQEQIVKATGFTPTLFRPTYGGYTNTLKGYTDLTFVLWDVDSRDWQVKTKSKISQNVLPNVKSGSIILMHDTKKQTITILEKLLNG